jgi:surface antigen
MVGSPVFRLATAVAFCLLTAACASSPDDYFADDLSGGGHARRHHEHIVQSETPSTPLQCVVYARDRTGINIRGDAADWWDRAAGKYARGKDPILGSILVLTGYAGPHRSHLAVVTAMISDREIRIDHANWFDDGTILRNDPVIDVSPDNDWSEVRVFNPRTDALGVRTYLVQGFIGPGLDNPQMADAY